MPGENKNKANIWNDFLIVFFSTIPDDSKY